MKTLIKILYLSLFTFVIANDTMSFKNEAIFENDNVILELRDGTIYGNAKIISMDGNWTKIKTKYSGNLNLRTNKVRTIKSFNGTLLYGTEKRTIINDKQSPFISNEALINGAGRSLVEYKEKSYTGLILSLAGSALIISNPANPTVGSALTLLGYIISIQAINDVGIAGEKLQKVEIKE